MHVILWTWAAGAVHGAYTCMIGMQQAYRSGTGMVMLSELLPRAPIVL